MSSINLQESQLSGCETYIAIVVDESGSINATEAQQIRSGLTSFINSQAQGNITLSLIGMSDNDSTLRTDNIIQKRISSNTSEFLTWTNSFGSGRVNKQSDYWASGLKAASELSVTPDIIVVVTDGMQVNNSDVLKSLYRDLNLRSQIFVYGVTSNANNISELVTPLTTFLEKPPILKNSGISILNSDYIRVADFSTLGNELNQLNTDLSRAQVGCVANVSIIQNKLVYPVLRKGLPVHKEAGTLVLKNKSRVALSLPAGTRIHNASSLDGLVFKIESTITIPGSSTQEVAIRIDGTPLLTGNFSAPVVLNKVGNPLGISINFNVTKELYIVGNSSGTTALQSAHLQIAAVGSKGVDSTKGIHLRWMLAGQLGEKHLPKGDLFTGTRSNFNKPDDFVKVYRAPYTKVTYSLNFNQTPNLVDNSNALWIYKTTNPERSVYVYFKNKAKYLSVKATINPRANPSSFIEAYGNNLIEIENKNELFFAAELNFNSVNNSSALRLETLSVAENTILASKRVTNRKTYSSTEVNLVRVVAENGRSIRFKANNCLLNTIHFEFYSDFIQHANTNGNWDLKGKYALSDKDSKVFEQLEPKLNSVNGKWLKYNDGEYVNITNYKNRWNKTTTGDSRNIKQVVARYLELSNVPDNPTGVETITFGEDIPVNEPLEGETQQYAKNLTEISNLDMLNIAANDYHIARMLGLGCIDIDDAVYSGEFIYLTEYTTFGNLEGGTSEKEVLHLSMSIPTSVNTERLPLPVQLSKIVPGLNIGSDESQPAKITDPDGYSFDGKKRYVSLFMDDVMDYDINTEFFKSSLEFDGSSFTFPIYLGVDYKIKDVHSTWVKPELAFDSEYKNINKNLIESYYEPAPIIIPESGKSILNVRQEEVGQKTYIYQGYGINIFSRASAGRSININSNIQPANNLMPPTGINTLLITEENPLMFTSQSEQVRYNAIPVATDKTLIRILFEYYTIQELLSYSIPDGMTNEDAVKPNTIYPDNEEIFADNFKLYYKDGLPQIEYASIYSIENSTTDHLTSIIKITEYKVLSTGEEIKVTLNDANKGKFIGGILTIGDQNYVIKEIDVILKTKQNIGDPDIFDYALVEVLKKEVSESILSDGDATLDSEQIKAIKKSENGLCTLVENMLTPTNWHQPGPLNFRVQYPPALKAVHREIIQPDAEDPTNLQVEKSRGIWNDAVIERVLEESYKMDAKGNFELDADKNPILLPTKKHLGLYRIIFSNYNLSQHPQFKAAGENSVEWFNGTIRLFTKSAVKDGNTIPVKSRKEFKVVRTENIGQTGDLIVYINDTNFKLGDFINQTMHPDHDEIIGAKDEGSFTAGYVSQKVNYYPSYKVYLYADAGSGITASNIQPREGESTHYSIFGISTHSDALNYDSKISVPSPMYAVKIVEPQRPDEVEGSLYATRPDFYNRSTYTFTTKYNHKPYGALHYRANDEDLLSVLYKRDTINVIREKLKKLGGNDEAYFSNRWKNFLDFDLLEIKVNYETYPPENESELGYHFPVPDNLQLIAAINDFIKWHNESQGKNVVKITSLTALNQVIIARSQGVQQDLLAVHFIEQAIHAAFVPLTEVPVIYEYIKGNDYIPSNKKQTIKDKSGHILKSTDADFDIAPMMKITNDSENRTQFTDFNLDGNSQNIYFYGVREMDIKMNFSEFSKLLGPVKLVASTSPQTPEIKRIMPILENKVLGIKPAIQIELNTYQPEYKIKKINIYRATSMLDAQSIRTMTPVKEIVINEDTLSTDFNDVWTVYDEFDDLEFVPFGDGLFYRITVSKEIEYANPGSTEINPIITVDYAPSQPSKITATVIVDNVSPASPIVEATGTVTGINESLLKPVVFRWQKTVHNGKYHLYKMKNQGNWEKIHEMFSNENNVILPLENVASYTDELVIKTNDEQRIYHHFKVLSENSSGMFSSEEKILTL
ncbi:VWA domain-containing protein [Flavobacterium sp. Fl-77]|uniref:VWA domain-containing protein n=1 Tax=Flavobacterium flavipigmentatum TaxID=2893884 RepID=A0AAJ2SE71_9FLAO|nr:MULTISPECIES: vWA domain-containing protein [unclassified Flavobacterium]MDX6182588.1 VWA domain-containing protein [Flavobacterium sp. Fl-33]MDX6186232.1 VWA domain-containing protein [Flavobacterium sp. Fl-77]UFH38379.1 VWA domain-containing protein [Flavobacterium sp. F-70]